MPVKRIPKEIHDEILVKVKAGEKVSELADRYGISNRTIYGWLTTDSGEETISVLKYNKLKKENEELKRIIGKLTLDMSWGKKG